MEHTVWTDIIFYCMQRWNTNTVRSYTNAIGNNNIWGDDTDDTDDRNNVGFSSLATHYSRPRARADLNMLTYAIAYLGRF